MWHAVHFLIAYQDYVKDILLQLGVSNHLPTANSKCPLCHLTEHSWFIQKVAGKLAKGLCFMEDRAAVTRHKHKNFAHNEKGTPAGGDVKGNATDALIKLVLFTTDCRAQAGLTWINLDISLGIWQLDQLLGSCFAVIPAHPVQRWCAAPKSFLINGWHANCYILQSIIPHVLGLCRKGNMACH